MKKKIKKLAPEQQDYKSSNHNDYNERQEKNNIKSLTKID